MTDDDLTTLRGVGPAIADNLRDYGFESAGEVLAADVDELTEVELIGEQSARGILQNDAQATVGRDPIVDEHIDEIAQLAELPVSDRGVIRLSDIGWSTHKDWKNREGEPYATYRDVWDEHRGKAEQRLAEEVAQNDPRFLLERAFGYIKEEKREVDASHEHAGEGGGPIEVQLNETVVETGYDA